MKTNSQQAPRFLALAALAALGFTAPAQAQAPASSGEPVHVDKVGEFTYVVRVSNPAQQRTKVRLVRLSDGAVLHEGYSKQPTFGEKFNVQQLPDGQYAFDVVMGKNTHRYQLNLSTTVQRSTMLSMAMPAAQ
jgi:hypothetical protein